MNILAFDTSSEIGGITLLDSENAIFNIRIEDTNRIAENIYSFINRLLKDSGKGLKDIGLFTAVLGPGSFTGLRVSLSVIKAFSLSLNKPVFGIDTMRLMAYSTLKLKGFNKLAVIQNARRGEVFLSIYDKELNQEGAIRIVTIESLTRILMAGGFIVSIRESEIKELLPRDIEIVEIDKDLSVPCAELSLKLYNQGSNIYSVSDIEPIYVRNDIVRKKSSLVSSQD